MNTIHNFQKTKKAGIILVFSSLMISGVSMVYATSGTIDSSSSENIVDLPYVHINSGKSTTSKSNYNIEKTGAIGTDSIAIGKSALAEGDSSVDIGVSSKSSGAKSIAIGKFSKSEGDSSVGIGYISKATGDYAIAIGFGNAASFRKSIVIGSDAKSKGNYSVAVGDSSQANEASVAYGPISRADGIRSIAISEVARANDAFSIAIGREATVGLSIADEPDKHLGGIANGAIAIGKFTRSLGYGSVSLGRDAEANAYGSVALGLGSEARENNTVSVGVASGSTRLGKEFTRRIVNVADGINGTDVATINQLNQIQGLNIVYKNGEKAHVLRKNGELYDVSNLSFIAGKYYLSADVEGKIYNNVDGKFFNVDLNKYMYIRAANAHSKPGYYLKKDVTMNPRSGNYTVEDANIEPLTGVDVAEVDLEEYKLSKDKKLKLAVPNTKDINGNPEMPLTNIADGIDLKDAVNLGQLNNMRDTILNTNIILFSGGTVNNGNYMLGTQIHKFKLSNIAFDFGEGLKAVNKLVDGKEIIFVGLDKTAIKSDSSFKGLTGDKGPQGDKGLTGDKGPQGDKGLTGDKVSTNNKSSQGAVDKNVVDNITNQINSFANHIQNIDEKVIGVAALSAAISAMKLLDYNPLEKTQIMAGVGYYKGTSAIALGVAHHMSNDLVINGGVALNVKDIMFNAGVSWRIGFKSRESEIKSNDQMIVLHNLVVNQARELKMQNKKIRKLEKEIKQLIEMVKKYSK